MLFRSSPRRSPISSARRAPVQQPKIRTFGPSRRGIDGSGVVKARSGGCKAGSGGCKAGGSGSSGCEVGRKDLAEVHDVAREVVLLGQLGGVEGGFEEGEGCRARGEEIRLREERLLVGHDGEVGVDGEAGRQLEPARGGSQQALHPLRLLHRKGLCVPLPGSVHLLQRSTVFVLAKFMCCVLSVLE